MEEKFGNTRPSWDEYFMLSALAIASRSSCLNIRAGAVIVKNKRIISTGYNGPAPRLASPFSLGYCRKEKEAGVEFSDKNTGNCFAIHAEVNAILQIANESLKGTTMYSLLYPCADCAKTIVGAGIDEIVWLKYYKEKDTITDKIFKEAKIKVRQMDFDPKCLDMLKEIFNDKRT